MRRAFLGVMLVACGRGHQPEPAPSTATKVPPLMSPVPAAPAVATSASGAACTLAPIAAHRTAPGRVVAIGDLHGDLDATRAAFRAAGAIDTSDHWIGGNLVVVQTGDAIDRGDGDREILDLLARIGDEAHAAGGELVQLLGNHELMNAAGDFRYVTPGGFHDFDGVAGIDVSHVPAEVAASARARVAALAPGGLYAKRLAAHNVIAIVGDTVYSHAGVLGDWVTKVDDVNLAARCWLDGQGPSDEPPALTAEDGPVWTRAVGMPEVDCTVVARALAALGVKRMVVGHTVQPHGVTSACDGTLWRVDVGMTAMFGGPIQVLELPANGAPKILTGQR